jgi:glutamate formiminotransferase/formiminotetrahydrofolate cyclodeaminase
MATFECVPNFSEGRDATRIETIVAAARDVPGAAVIDVESDADHNRSVVTLVGGGAALVEAALGMARVAIELIDLNSHRGAHPRMGAIDVVPFVPLGDASMDQAAELATQFGERVWAELGVPVYLYGAAARTADRRDLAHVRAGQFEGLRDAVASDPARRPDFGDAALHPTAGAVAVGARPVLIAYNAYLSTSDVDTAKRVAHAVRARDGGLAEVKALGFFIAERGQAQVSMNLTDHRRTPMHRALDAVRREAARYGVTVTDTEVVGMVPEDALLDAAEFYLQLNSFDRGGLLERRAVAATTAPSLAELCAQTAARTPTPGGGSAAAAAGALGAALAEMLTAYADGADVMVPAGEEFAAARQRFLGLVDEDAASFEAVRAARRARRERPDDAEATVDLVEALRYAANVPQQTEALALACLERLRSVRDATKAGMASDLTTAVALLEAARVGAGANVEINLADLEAVSAGQSR